MLRAKEAEHAQHILIFVLVVFLIGMTVNYYAPSKESLEAEVGQLKQDIDKEKNLITRSGNCKPNTLCLSQLQELRSSNWVMECSTLEERIAELQQQAAAGNQCSTTAPEDCQQQRGRLAAELTRQYTRLRDELEVLQERALLSEQRYNEAVKEASRPQPDKQYTELLGELSGLLPK